MITYRIAGGGGTIAGGIPSLDVAISILKDMERDQDEPAEVVYGDIEDCQEQFWHTENEYRQTNLVIDAVARRRELDCASNAANRAPWPSVTIGSKAVHLVIAEPGERRRVIGRVPNVGHRPHLSMS